MADAERIRHAARHVAHEAGSGTHIAVVCSAMAGETNRLTHLAEEFQVSTSQDEYDAILASGEQVSSALMALALREEGLKARSWTGWQAGITTTGAHGHTRLGDCDLTHLKHRIEEGEIAVLTGFQGVSSERRITTLGRGGSDLSAVALAAALKADYCTIYTDVDGVYTADPRIEDKARRLDRLSFEEMLEMASVGAKVLQGRAAVLAMVHHVPLRIASSFSETGTEPEGTWVCDEEDIVEQRVVSGIAYSRHEAGLTLIGLPSHPEAKARIFNALARVHANIDMIVQSDTSQKERINLVLTVEKNDLSKAVRALETEQELYGFEKLVSGRKYCQNLRHRGWHANTCWCR